MNRREVQEIRRRFSPEKDSISHIYGCYVNASGEIVARIDMPLGLMEQEEAEMYLKILKKSLSGSLGRNLMDIEFSTTQVENSHEHRLLSSLRQSHLKDENAREIFYSRVIENIDFEEESYAILMAADSYDVPFKGSDDEVWEDGSSEVFDYIICAICPVKDARSELRYRSEDKTFRSASTGHVLSSPEAGFMFPAFDGRCANIYGALYYSKNTSNIHEDIIETLFAPEKMPMAADVQKGAFGDALSEALGHDCSLDVVQAVHGEIREKLAAHKESKEPEQPEIYMEEVGAVLKHNGVPEEKISFFNQVCRREMGDSQVFNPGNLVEAGRFEMKTPKVKITVDPEFACDIETGTINEKKYILIPAEEGVSVNGIEVYIS